MKTKFNHSVSLFSLLALGLAFTASLPSAFAQGTAFTYQGRLFDGANPANGKYDLRFNLYDAATFGSLLVGVTNSPVTVTNGLFTVTLDFGAGIFTGPARWLEIGVRSNTVAVAFTPLTSSRQQLTPTPYAIFAESANAAGLSGSIPPGDLSGVSGTGLTGVALLAGGNNFSGNQSVTGMVQVIGSEQITGASGAGFHVDENIGPNTYYVGEEHGINFNYAVGGNIGSLLMGYNGQGYFSVGNMYNIGSNTKAFTVFGDGNVNIDPMDMNNGFLNNGATTGAGLTFGVGSGEGIASDRTSGLNKDGLDFYTSFTHRMSILQNGNVGIGITNPASKLEVGGDVRLDGNHLYLEPSTGVFANDGLVFGDGGLAGGINFGGNGPWLAGYYGGALGALAPNIVALSWDSAGNVAVNQKLTVLGEFSVVNGAGNEQAYMGGDGSGGDVQFGSLNSGIDNVAFFNATKSTYMHIYCSSITIEGGADLAEPFTISARDQAEVPQGAVVVIDEQNPGHLKVSDQSYDTHVAGVVSGANGINPGIQMQQQGILEGGKNVALTGRVYVQADTSNGAIKPGDLLTTSSAPGRAMKVTDHARAAGAILGKAMTGLSEGKGMVLVLVTLQ